VGTVGPFSLSFSSNLDLDDANGLVLLLLLVVVVLSSPRLLLLCPISGSQCKERAERGLSKRRLRLTEGEVPVSDEVLREEGSAADDDDNANDDDILDGPSARAELNVRGKAMATGSRLPLLPFASLALALALALALVRWDG
jgi:hypothetical protein